MAYDRFGGIARGHVRMIRDGVLLFDKANTVVDLSLEIMIQALIGNERIQGISFARMKRPVSPGMRSLASPVGYVSASMASASRDAAGLRSIGTWQAQFTPSQALTYDTIGLVTTVDRLFAAVATGDVSLAAGETVEVEWTITMGSTA